MKLNSFNASALNPISSLFNASIVTAFQIHKSNFSKFTNELLATKMQQPYNSNDTNFKRQLTNSETNIRHVQTIVCIPMANMGFVF